LACFDAFGKFLIEQDRFFGRSALGMQALYYDLE